MELRAQAESRGFTQWDVENVEDGLTPGGGSCWLCCSIGGGT